MKVLKFGGSSLATPERMRDVAHIVLRAAKNDRIVVVVSAFQGITNQLLECARLAEAGNTSYESLFEEIARRHRSALNAVLGRRSGSAVRRQVDALLEDLREVLHGIYLLHHCPPLSLDLATSFGERLSAQIFAEFLSRSHPALFVDARDIITTDAQFTHAAVNFEKTNPRIRSRLGKLARVRGKTPIAVVTGFIGSTEDGRTTTLGRNGSDYTAAIVGAALNASLIEIWTDVDGILSADPSAVPSAFTLPSMSYEEAMELSYFGAKVLHAATIAPAVAKNIPILIKNTLNLSSPGTLISRRAQPWDGVAKGISSVDGITLLTLRGMSMVGVPGTAERLFRALASHRVNVILISQASSEHTICFAVSTNDVANARKAVQTEFRFELHHKLTSLDEKDAQTIIAIVGDGMKGTPGVSGKVFNALGQNNINVSAIAQGASERNISFVIDSAQKVRALNVIHQAFFEKRKRLNLVVVGVGNVGSALLHQLYQQQKELLEEGFDVRVIGIANSKRFVLSPAGIALHRWREELADSSTPMNPHALVEEIARLELTNVALVDCTASPEVVDAYPQFVNANMHIITPNKRANVLPWKQYQALMSLLERRQKHFLYEANVGAGLPIISTLRDLVASGDRVHKVEGIFSGTLSYLFNSYTSAQPFSKLVQDAHRLGYTEPDPRDDLSGEDVARKLLILARELGLKMDLKDVKFENLVPAPLRRGSFSKDFFIRFARYDAQMLKRLEHARLRGAVLRYVASLEGNRAQAGLREIPQNHPFAATKGSDNIIMFTTQRYSKTPLVVQGPGAGADVTAMGVFSDILKLLHWLPY
ncbi:MAG TPA: bifunctional aspartate kinase/homoserine dehydrogenase I [Bacteroidota bacterium]|nr:bifunctional aspartate kinase/homoserine dehydrogenase I [Bacteroidota bacterium]